ncbi:invasion associated locus B family protein [Terrarubrum flagellatum]|uniref:invasion associated locus B family protein n=1 Tax=Terrirubrum flagellatum TaxID=2895980 RepID=UPI0031455091
MRLGTRLVALVMTMVGTAHAAEQGRPVVYAVKPSDVIVPEGETLGEYRRVIQPFRNWTLICDESFKSKRRVCNLTQSIVNDQGAVVFNWSLMATADGKPLMMMRVPATVGMGQQIEIAMGQAPDRIAARIDRCDANFCYAVIAVGDMLRKHIRAGTECAISYQDARIGVVAFRAPLDGLLVAPERIANGERRARNAARSNP